MPIEDDVLLLQTQMATLLGTTIPALEAADTALDGRLDTAETDIGALEVADTGLDTRLDTVEAGLVSLGVDVAAAESSISGVQALSGTSAIQLGKLTAAANYARLRPGRGRNF